MEDKEVIEFLKDAFELKRQGKYKRAAELLYRALTVCPENPEILMQVAELHMLLHNPSSACAILERLIEQKPNDVDIFQKLVSFYTDNYNFDKAKDLLEKFVMSYPSENAYCVYLEQYVKIKDYKKAVAFYEEKGLDKFASYKLNKIYGIALCMLKKYEHAKNVLNNIYESGHADDDTLFYLAQTLYLLNERDKAYSLANDLVNRTEDAKVYNLCGEIELSGLKYEKAIDYFTMAVKAKSDGLYFYNLASAYFLNGQFDEAKTFFSKAVSVAGDVKEYKYALAYLHYTINEYSKAKHIVSALLEQYPDFREAILLNINILIDEHKYCSAEQTFYQCSYAGKDTDAEILKLGVKIFKALYKTGKAETLLTELIKLKPDSPDLRYELAELYYDEMKYDDALTISLRLVTEHPNYLNAYVLSAKIYQKTGAYEKALKMADKALALDLNSEEALYYKAMAKAALKEFDDAIAVLKLLISYNPYRVEAYAFLGFCYASAGDFETAKKYYSEAISFAPDNADYFVNIAMMELELNNRHSAIRYLNVAHLLKPENKYAAEKLIDLYIEVKNYKQAMRLLYEQKKRTKETELKNGLISRLEETETLYKKTANPVKYTLWKLFKI